MAVEIGQAAPDFNLYDTERQKRSLSEFKGQNVVLMRDMTDAMYNPRDEPFVNHFTGNDLVF